MFDRGYVANMPFDFIPQDSVAEVIDAWRQRDERHLVCVNNPNAVMLCRKNNSLRKATEHAGLILPDGFGVILAVVAALLVGTLKRRRDR